MLADAHLHFFRPGHIGGMPESCRRVQPTEFELYQALAAAWDVRAVLAVGYEEPPYAGNNAYLAYLAAAHDWVRPVAFVPPAELSVPRLEMLARQRFVGVSLYIFGDEATAALGRAGDDVWRWLAQRRMLVSVNARGETWRAWSPILQRHPELRLLISHLGLPPQQATAPPAAEAQRLVQPVLELAQFPAVHVKLSGFYAMSDPAHDYPHRTAWPYIEQVRQAFGIDRLLWGSDFAPALEFVTFPQTFALLERCAAWTEQQRQKVLGENLRVLLAQVAT